MDSVLHCMLVHFLQGLVLVIKSIVQSASHEFRIVSYFGRDEIPTLRRYFLQRSVALQAPENDAWMPALNKELVTWTVLAEFWWVADAC